MRDRAVISPRFWAGATGRYLRKNPDAQRLAFYLLTCPLSNMIGLYYLPIPIIVHELNMSEKAVRAAFKYLEGVEPPSVGVGRGAEGVGMGLRGCFATYDEETETVFVYKMALWQIGRQLVKKDNRIRMVERMVGEYKKCRFYNAFLHIYKEPYQLKLEEIRDPLRRGSEGVEADSPQEQDQEQEQDQDQEILAAKPPQVADGVVIGQVHDPSKPAPKPRPRDLLFGAVVEVTTFEPMVECARSVPDLDI